MKTVIVTGKSIDDAVQEGLRQLNATEDRITMTVLEQPAKGLFGIFGVKDAKVQLELLPDPLEEAIHFLKDMLAAMKVQVEIQQKKVDDGVELNMTGPELGILIGKRGQTLDSLQYLVNIVANRHADKHLKILLDAEQFRARRRSTLEDLAHRLASRAVKTRKEIVLEPMSPAERKIIHTELQNHPQVKTYSKGEEPNRRVVIGLK